MPDSAATVLARITTPHTNLGPENTYHEWITLGDRVTADRTGRSNARVVVPTWTEWLCNNPDCSGTALVADAGIVHLIQEAEDSL